MPDAANARNNAAPPPTPSPEVSDEEAREDVNSPEMIRALNAEAPPPDVKNSGAAPALPTGTPDTGPTYGAAGATPEGGVKAAPSPHARLFDAALSALSGQPGAKPGQAWRGIIAGALAGAAAGSKAHDFFGGVAEGAGAAENRNIAQRQLQMENQLKANAEQRAQQEAQQRATLNAAQIAKMNQDTLTSHTIAHNSDIEAQARLRESASTLSQPYLDAGAQSIGQGLTDDELHSMLKQKNLDPSKQIVFQDGEVPILGIDGKPTGEMQATYRVMTPPPEVTIGKDQAAMLKSYGYDVPEGTTMSGLQYGSLAKRVENQEAIWSSINATKAKAGLDEAEARKDEEELRQSRQTNNALTRFGPYLAGSGGDPLTAIQHMSESKDDAPYVGYVEKAYGGAMQHLETQGETPVIGVDKNGQTVFTSEREARAQGMTSITKATPKTRDDAAQNTRVLNEMQVKSNAVAETSNALNQGAAQSAIIANALSIDPHSTGSTVRRRFVMRSATDLTKEYVQNVLSLREAVLGLPKVMTGAGRMQEQAINAIYQTVPGGVGDSKYAIGQLQKFQQMIDRQRQGIPRVEGVTIQPISQLIGGTGPQNAPPGKPVYVGGKIAGYTTDGKTMVPVQ